MEEWVLLIQDIIGLESFQKIKDANEGWTNDVVLGQLSYLILTAFEVMVSLPSAPTQEQIEAATIAVVDRDLAEMGFQKQEEVQ
jgi:hypothetical protein